jgi:hypothetical protein
MIVHTAIDLGEGGMRIVDVWESQEAFETLRDQRLLPALQVVLAGRGIEPQGTLSYEFSEIHHLVKA